MNITREEATEKYKSMDSDPTIVKFRSHSKMYKDSSIPIGYNHDDDELIYSRDINKDLNKYVVFIQRYRDDKYGKYIEAYEHYRDKDYE